MTKCTTTLGIIGAEGMSMKGDYMNKFRHVSRKEKVQLASRARQILDDAAREQELDIPIFVTPAQKDDERAKHLRELRNVSGNFEEDEARAVLETLSKKYPHIAVDAIHEGLDATRDRAVKACMEGLK